MKQPSRKIQRLALKQFTAFENVEFEFCPGINVIIGANSTGKTLTIKILYALLKICHTLRQRRLSTDGDFTDIMMSKLQGIFQLHWLNDLIRVDDFNEEIKQKVLEVRLDFAETYISLKLEHKFNRKEQKVTRISPTFQLPDSIISAPSPIYLPSQEILSINRGFISIYQNRELPYDETYYDLSLALNAVPLRKEKLVGIQDILTLLKTILCGNKNNETEDIIIQENDQFYFNLPDGRFEAHFVAEGYRKIATLLYLLENGSLTKDSILFWAEPEANLNPKLIVQIVEVLKKLVSAGMQIFVTTHDYLLSHELSLVNEYQTDTALDVKFFALHQPEKKAGIVVESGQTLAEIQENPILEEFAAHYDREVGLFQQSEI